MDDFLFCSKPINNQKIILHIDIDTFFCSVESNLALDKKKHLNNPIIVTSNNDQYGIVVASNYEARKYNIFPGMPIFKAKQNCNILNIINPHYSQYNIYSKLFIDIISTYTNKFEILSIDELYLDATNIWQKFKSIKNLIINIKTKIYKKLKLNVSIGASFTKYLAKSATNFCKPNNYFILNKNNLIKFLKAIKLNQIYLIGKKMIKIFTIYNLFTGYDVIYNPYNEELINIFGKKYLFICSELLGISNSNIQINSNNNKQISISKTYNFVLNKAKIIDMELIKLSTILWNRLFNAAKTINTISVGVKYKENFNKWKSHQLKLIHPTNEFNFILKKIKFLFQKLFVNNFKIIALQINFNQLSSIMNKNKNLNIQNTNNVVMKVNNIFKNETLKLLSKYKNDKKNPITILHKKN